MVFEPHIPEPKDASISERAAALACHRLGLSPVKIKYFQPSDKEPVRNGRQKGLPFEAESGLRGVCTERLLTGKKEIWIRSGLSEKELCITIAHEIYHYAVSDNEQKAELFGHQIWQEMTAPRNEWYNHLYFQ